MTFCFHVYVCYFACSVFACNPVWLSLESIKGNLLTYLIRNDFTQLAADFQNTFHDSLKNIAFILMMCIDQ